MALKARSLTVEKTRKFHLWLVISRTQGAKVAARAGARGGRTCGYQPWCNTRGNKFQPETPVVTTKGRGLVSCFVLSRD